MSDEITKGTRLRVHAGPKRNGVLVTTEVTYTGPGVCRRNLIGCRQAILWCRTQHGKQMPVDPGPDADGIYTSHWATCPKAEAFRAAQRGRVI